AGQAPPDGAAEAPGDRVLAEAARQLTEWFAGERTAFDLPLDLGAATAFQRRAWHARPGLAVLARVRPTARGHELDDLPAAVRATLAAAAVHEELVLERAADAV